MTHLFFIFVIAVLYRCDFHFLQPEAYLFHFWCERAFTIVKDELFYVTNKQASQKQTSKQDLKSNSKV